MTKLTFAKVLVIAVSCVAASSAVATAAPPSSSATMPLSAKWRACDFSQAKWVDAVGDTRAIAHVGTTGQGTVAAHVELATAPPDTFFNVQIIQMPRPSIGCAPGDAGVITGSLTTDAAGTGSVTLQGPVASGKTGAWVVVERPAANSQTPAEFLTTEFVAAI